MRRAPSWQAGARRKVSLRGHRPSLFRRVPLTRPLHGTIVLGGPPLFVISLSEVTMSITAMNSMPRTAQQFEDRWAKLRSHKRAVASLRFQVEWEWSWTIYARWLHTKWFRNFRSSVRFSHR